MGDRIEIQGDAIGAALGRAARVRVRDITVFKQTVDRTGLDEDLKRALKDARDAIEAAEVSDVDKADAADDLVKVAAELEKPEKDAGRLHRYLNRIKDVVAPAASILTSVASIARLIESLVRNPAS